MGETGSRWGAWWRRRGDSAAAEALWTSGPPPSMPRDLVRGWAAKVVGNEYARIAHRPWLEPPAGSYQVQFESDRRRETAIAKEMHVDGTGRTAGAELGVQPGPPEFTIYAEGSGALRGFLPAVLDAVAAEPGEHYLVLLEDLDRGWRTAEAGRDLLAACEALPRLHTALVEGVGGDARDDLLDLGRGFAQRVLEVFAATLRGTPKVAALSELWPTIERQWEGVVTACAAAGPVHGDLQPSRIRIRRDRMVVVDWEWAGTGAPELDLAALLEGAPDKIERRGVERYAVASGRAPAAVWRHYGPCALLRSVLTATRSAHAETDAGALDAAVARVVQASARLS